MAKKFGWGAALATGLLIAWFIAAPWLTVWQIRQAVQARDGQALAGHVDFDSVRQSLKDQVNALMLQKMAAAEDRTLRPLAALVAPLAGAVVNKMVDAYVTPSGLAQLMAGRQPRPPGAAAAAEADKARATSEADQETGKPLQGASMGYRSVGRFVVTAHGRQGDTQFVLGRRGVNWKLTEIILPLQ